ncbi:SIR2-domain-containing protein [Ceratobasidium sp. AG-I]|nr:SIR2-domain-containing protein [Ceratobasidium sp. AG-I]
MVGAGISTSAGIPDFRSPKTGTCANLARLNLPYPEAVFDIHFFRDNPVPFYTLAHELYPGKFRPTVTHSFIKLLADKGMLHMCFTQNIDTLERLAGIPASKLVEAHGSFAENHCVDCGAEFPADEMRRLVLARNEDMPGGVNVPKCKRRGCDGLVKPDIVFFGESLPEKFHDSLSVLPFADVALVMGTSLAVHPFARLPELVSDRCPRVLMNMEVVGNFNRADDVVHLAPCDDAVRELADLLGWRDELEAEWAATESVVISSEGSSIPRTLAPEADVGKVEGAMKRVETGGMDDLAAMLAKGAKINDEKETPATSTSATEKTAQVVAEKTAAALDGSPSVTSISHNGTASIRVSLAWESAPTPIPDEESVLVLTAPTGEYVDIRIKLSPSTSSDPASDAATTAALSSTPTNDPRTVPPGSKLSWGFAGVASRTEDGKGGRWSRIVDSRTAVLDPAGEADEGQEVVLPNGDTKEWGVMDGKRYVEIWRSLDVGSKPEIWVANKEGGGGMVVRVGDWVQGVARNGEEVGAFRAHFREGGWKDVFRLGGEGVFPAVGGTKEGWSILSGGSGGTKL